MSVVKTGYNEFLSRSQYILTPCIMSRSHRDQHVHMHSVLNATTCICTFIRSIRLLSQPYTVRSASRWDILVVHHAYFKTRYTRGPARSQTPSRNVNLTAILSTLFVPLLRRTIISSTFLAILLRSYSCQKAHWNHTEGGLAVTGDKCTQ